MRYVTFGLAVLMLGIGFIAHSETQTGFKGDPYTLGDCPVSGETLGNMGDPVAYVHEGRDIKFCCTGCPPKFKADPAKYLTELDAQMIADQKPRYPLTTDVVSGEALPADDRVVDVIHLNRLVRFGSQENAQKFMKAPDGYLAKLNEAVIAKQKAAYPTDKCIVSDQGLDSMGEPVLKVYANRLVQFCCNNCPGKFEAEPYKYLTKLDAGKAGAGSTHHEGEHHSDHN